MGRGLVFGLLVVAGCGGKSDEDRCATVTSAGLDRSKPDLKDQASKDPLVRKALARLKEVMATRCREDHWSAAALSCLEAAKDTPASQTCFGDHLTKEQHDKLLLGMSTMKVDGKESAAAPALAKMSEFRDRMCTCKDQACVDAINKDMTEWGAQEAAKAKGEVKMDSSEKKLATRIGEEIGECTLRALTGSGK